MVNRSKRATIAEQTLAILNQGAYTATDGSIVNIATLIEDCRKNTRHLLPEQLDAIYQTELHKTATFAQMDIEVQNETALEGVSRLYESRNFAKISVLNFGSAKNPGGGFLGGSQAQEESLARSSALYTSLLECPEYYEFHRKNRNTLYSDRMIYSPACPIFRCDQGDLLPQPILVDFITSAAPNAGAIQRNQPNDLPKIQSTFKERMGKVLALAVQNGCDALILGAWGCGVFRNDPKMVAQLFRDYLQPGKSFHGHFRQITFSVLDHTKDMKTFNIFKEVLS